jgi:hypothetical protein
MALPADVMRSAIERSAGMSAAFIKELMRRVALLSLERDPDVQEASAQDLDQAFGELLFEGGTLNAKLLGAVAPAER